MTTTAWVMMLTTWSVITVITIRLFWLVLKTPPRSDGD